jgi:hypothetical protein
LGQFCFGILSGIGFLSDAGFGVLGAGFGVLSGIGFLLGTFWGGMQPFPCTRIIQTQYTITLTQFQT